jgi:RNA polymerase sigma-70 factor, ECF subfamily
VNTSSAPTEFVGEPDLIRRARAGDRAAFTGLVTHYWQLVYRWLYRWTHRHHTAEDLTQETFLKAFTGLHSFRTGNSWWPWLRRIAYHTFLNQRRAERMKRVSLPDDLPDREPEPLKRLLTREHLERLAEAVRRLPASLREALLLRTEGHLRFRDMAAALKTSVANARWRVFMARKRVLSFLRR